MSYSKPTPKQLVPFQQENVATNQQAIPLPCVCGTRVIAGRFATPAMNEVIQQVPGAGKKG